MFLLLGIREGALDILIVSVEQSSDLLACVCIDSEGRIDGLVQTPYVDG